VRTAAVFSARAEIALAAVSAPDRR